METTRRYALAAVVILLCLLAACTTVSAPPEVSGESVILPPETTEVLPTETPAPSPQLTGQIYLYGEQHGVEIILDKEFEIWHDYYHNDNMRHLFIEYAYYTAGYLNLWMQSDDDTILEAIYGDWTGTFSRNPLVKKFFQKIKSECPETIFHGTDIGHQYDTTGARYLHYLTDNGRKDTEQYKLTQQAISQGKSYYKYENSEFRENKMAENFIREFDKLGEENIMGIYGAAHTDPDALDFYNTVPCMANQLREVYGDALHSEDLSWVLKDIEPLRTDTISVNGKEYEASYFGRQDLSGFKDFAARDFWRLENAYDDFKDISKTGDVLPYDNYPMLIELEQIFVIDYTKTNGSVTRAYYRSSGSVWQNKPVTDEFRIE